MKKRSLQNGLKLGKKVISNLENDKVLGGAGGAHTAQLSCWLMTRAFKCHLTLGPSNCTRC